MFGQNYRIWIFKNVDKWESMCMHIWQAWLANTVDHSSTSSLALCPIGKILLDTLHCWLVWRWLCWCLVFLWFLRLGRACRWRHCLRWCWNRGLKNTSFQSQCILIRRNLRRWLWHCRFLSRCLSWLSIFASNICCTTDPSWSNNWFQLE